MAANQNENGSWTLGKLLVGMLSLIHDPIRRDSEQETEAPGLKR
jgi:hypothetical protein